MIDKITYTKEHLLSLVKKYKTDPQLLERAIFALGLLEAISKVSKDFCFKGGSSLMILTEKPRRLSTDIDIIVEPDFAKNIKKTVTKEGISENQSSKLNFWTRFNDVMARRKEFNIRKPSTDHWYDFSIGTTTCHLSADLLNRE